MRAKASIAITLSLTLASCQGDANGGSEMDPDPGAESSTGDEQSNDSWVGDSAGSSATTEQSPETASTGADASDDPTANDDETSGGVTGSAGDTGELEEIEVLNMASAASAINGDRLTILNYTVPADGVLVVRGGAAGPPVESVTFGGEVLTAIASHEEPDYWFAISADMYWMPVTAGESGEIAWQYQPGTWTTRRRGMIAVTISGVDQVHALTTASDGLGTNEGRTGPSSADLEITTMHDAIILSAFTSNGPGPSELTGLGHTLDAFPTVPIEEFHSTRVYAGHMRVGPGTISLGYENADAGGWFDYVLFLAAFTRSE